MFTQGFGEIITDILTTNPSLSGIPSASAILDTSNYTIRVITLGKDGEGFKFHAHTVSSQVGNLYNDGYVQFQVRNTLSPSSYHSSATHNYYSATYNSLPSYPSVTDTRLERKSTATNTSSLDLGHYVNAAIDPSLSAVWNIVGAYPPSSNTSKFRMLDSSGGFVASGNLSGLLNTKGAVDRYGYITIDVLSPELVSNPLFLNGPHFGTSASFSALPILYVIMALQYGDGASIAAFGGINHFGLWSINLKELIRNGLNPPYDIKNINISSKYKLIAKTTVWKDLLKQDDYAALGISGFKTILAEGGYGPAPLTYFGPTYTLQINFT